MTFSVSLQLLTAGFGTDRRIAASSEPGQLTEGHQKWPVPSLVLAATAGSDPIRSAPVTLAKDRRCKSFTG
jgi:hypothetical protein